MGEQNILNRKTETIISFIALVAITAIIAAVFLVQADYDMSRFGIITGDNTDSKSATTVSAFDISADFATLSPPEEYSPDTLYEKINGKAPLYNEAGFELLASQRFTFSPQPEIWVEIYRYRMSSPDAAYYVYSTQKRARAAVIDGLSPEHACKTTSGIYLAAGPDYFEINASAESEEVLAALIGCINNIAKLNSPENSLYELTTLLPDTNAITGTFKLYLDGAFGIGDLGKVYLRDYEIDGQKLTAFAIPDGDRALPKFQEFMDENGAEKISDDDDIAVYDLFGVYEAINLDNGYLIGIHEADDDRTAIDLIKIITNR